jgi:hypothetical protein
MLTVVLLLVFGALVTAIASTMSRCPLWVSVVLLCIVVAIQVMPLK